MQPRPLKPSEAYDIWAKNPTPENMNMVLLTVEQLLNKAMTSYGGASPVTKSKAKLLAIKAIKSFDPDKNVKLETHLWYQLQPLIRFNLKQNPTYIPERAYGSLKLIQDAEKTFLDKHDRPPTDEELSDLVNLSVHKINKLRGYNIRSTNLTTDEEMLDLTPEQLIESDEQMRIQDTWRGFVYHDLSPIKQKIYDYKMGTGGQVLSNKEIAEKLNLSPGRISQLSADIDQKLNESLTEFEGII